MSRLAVLLALLLPCLPGRAGQPSEVELGLARQLLQADEREGIAGALDTLVREGGRESLEAIAEYGARTAFPHHAALAGQALVRADAARAASLVARQMKAYRKQPDRLVRVARMAAGVPDRAGREMLLQLAKDKREVVAATAVAALGHRGEKESRSVLLPLLRSRRTAVATATAFALARLPPDEETMEALFKRVQAASDERTGDACAIALTRIEGAAPFGDRALALLIKRSSHESFHALVKTALRLAKPPSRDLIDVALKSPSVEVREVACDMIGLNRMQGYAKILLRLATSEHGWRNQVAAWLALRRAGIGDEADGILSNLAKRGEASYWAIQCVIQDPPAAFLSGLRAAALDTKDEVRRELAQRALRNAAQARDETRRFYLETIRTNRATDRARAALLGIGNLKDPDSFHALVTLLDGEADRRVQLDILRALEKLTGHFYEPDPAIWREWFEVVEGRVAFDPKPIDRKANRERMASVRDLGVTPQTEAAVENGLRWLARHQDLDGGWNGATYHENCWTKAECAKEGGIRNRPLAYTGLALLAFQGAGYTHVDGPYHDVVQRGFQYLLSQQDYDGSHEEKGWTFSYEAAIVCQALCDGFALTGDPFLGEGAQRMLDYLVKIQYPGRTWRYRVRDSSTDTSVMSWILTACISARHAGLDMPEQIFVSSEAWLDGASDPVPYGEYEIFVRDQFKKDNPYFIDVSRGKTGKHRDFKIKTWYQPPRLYTPAMSAIGCVVRIWLGWTRAHPFCIGSANQVISQIPGYGTGLEGEFAFYPYTWYYGSLAMYQMGGRYWSRWRDGCIKDVIRNQRLSGCEHGSWQMPRGQLAAGLTGGTVYTTCMAILTLETFYRYQPYLARFDLRSREEAAADGGSDGPADGKGAGGDGNPADGGPPK